MAGAAIPEEDTLPEAEADARFGRLVGNQVNTPHQPHKPKPASAKGPKATGQ